MRSLRWLLVGFYALMAFTPVQAGVVGIAENYVGGVITLLDTASPACVKLSKEAKHPFFDVVVTAPGEPPETNCWTFKADGRVMIVRQGDGTYVYPLGAFQAPTKK